MSNSFNEKLDEILNMGFVDVKSQRFDTGWPVGSSTIHAPTSSRERAKQALLDPLWKSGKIKRGQAYAYIGNRTGKQYHTGELRSIEEAREVYRIILKLKGELE